VRRSGVNLGRRIKIQLALFTVIAVTAGSAMIFRYINAPAMLFGVGRYAITVELPRAAGMYPNANVSYRGTEVGRVESVQLTASGVRAVLSLRSEIQINSNLRAEVHSQNAMGEQYVMPVAGSYSAAAIGGTWLAPTQKLP
jgi:phospholipid/cholesterol/gamma-HCH transport system substrate-binding protein